jgi:DNA-binding transcriptional ArsR family regulator
MAKKKFLLLSLEDAQSKKVADAVGNKSARKILEYLADSDGTESELAKKLGIALSTVHYNLQQLVKAGLITVDEFHYSEKGREVNHYRLANQYIIIAPKKEQGLREKLRGLLPVVGIMGVFSGGILGVQRFLSGSFASVTSVASDSMDMVVEQSSGGLMDDIAAAVVEEAEEEASEEVMRVVATSAKESVDGAATSIIGPSFWASLFDSVAFWFFIGGLFALAVYLVRNWWRNR